MCKQKALSVFISFYFKMLKTVGIKIEKEKRKIYISDYNAKHIIPIKILMTLNIPSTILSISVEILRHFQLWESEVIQNIEILNLPKSNKTSYISIF